MSALDRRLNAFRPDLADERLRAKVEAERFVAGRRARVTAPVADLRGAPRADSGVDAQLLHGDDVLVFDEREGWAWVQAVRDSYVGYTAADGLAEPGETATHMIAAPRSFVYPGPDLKFPATAAFSMGSLMRVAGEAETRGTRYALLADGGAMIAAHLAPVADREPDYVSAAERLVFTPYLWGGSSAFGIDCSGLVQLAMRMTGRTVPRDSDMQAAGLGEALAMDEGPPSLRRGDLVFWKGHVAILMDDEDIVHASGNAMMVVTEPLSDAIARIRPVHGEPTGYRRP